jgi:hypothetical protein
LGEANELWSLVLVPADDFEDAFEQEGAGSIPVLKNYYNLYHAVIEVIDKRSGRLLASRRVPAFVFGFADSRHVISYREAPDLLPRLDVWRFSLKPGGNNVRTH